MPMMSRVERRFCSSGAWRRLVRTTVAPWVLQGRDLQGEVLEVGGGSGASALLRSDLTRCVVDRAVGGVAMRFSATRAVPRA